MIMICPQCQRAEMLPDDSFHNVAVFRCPKCCWYVTPRTYRVHWRENLAKARKRHPGAPNLLIPILAALAAVCAIWSLS